MKSRTDQKSRSDRRRSAVYEGAAGLTDEKGECDGASDEAATLEAHGYLQTWVPEPGAPAHVGATKLPVIMSAFSVNEKVPLNELALAAVIVTVPDPDSPKVELQVASNSAN